jgi:folate-dependent phosphoribosylglycinamide formyltransferase PurN
VFIVASDEPVYLVPYLRGVIHECRARIVGVGVHMPARRRISLHRTLSLALLSLLVVSPRQWWRLAMWKCADALAAVGIGRTRHHLADVCREAGIPLQQVGSVNADVFVAWLREQRIDVLFHQTPEILRAPVLQAPAVAVLNRHMSVLPAYRGAWPLFWQFADGETEVGVSFHVVDEGIDSGAIVVQEAVTRRPGESMAAVLARLFERAVPLTCTAFDRLARGKPEGCVPADGASSGVVYRTPTAGQILRYLFTPGRSSAASR